jgi:hypothetical protein
LATTPKAALAKSSKVPTTPIMPDGVIPVAGSVRSRCAGGREGERIPWPHNRRTDLA